MQLVVFKKSRGVEYCGHCRDGTLHDRTETSYYWLESHLHAGRSFQYL